MKDLLFSFDGRLPRKPFWLFGVLPLALLLAVVRFADTTFHLTPWLFNATVIATIWPAMAIQFKRWQDRDKSGWWILINLIPILGTGWALIENGFMRGTTGSNRFGGDATGSY